MAEDQILNLPFKYFFKNASSAAALINIKGKILAANSAFLEQIGYGGKNISGWNILKFIPEESAIEVRGMLDRVVADSLRRCEGLETPFLNKDGEISRVMFNADLVKDLIGKPLCVMITLSEISAPQQPAISDNQARDEFHQNLESSPYALILVNEDRNIIGINQFCEKSFGFHRQELINRPAAHILPEIDHRIPKRSATKAKGPDSHAPSSLINTHALHKDGRRIRISLDLSPIHEGAQRHWVGIIQTLPGNDAEAIPQSHLAWHDTVTGLNNRVLFQERLYHAIPRAEREARKLGILFLDIDNFKRMNDSFGYQAGNQLLKDVATRIVDSVRKSDTVSRHNGDQFLILLEGLEKAENISKVAQKLIGIFEDAFPWQGQDAYLTASIGISVFPVDGVDGDGLVKNAESAMHLSKKEGGNTFHFYTKELNTRAIERMKLDSDLHRAIKQSEFVIHYQPVVKISGNEVGCLEALLRWQHPDKGMQPPLSFIPFLEETGLIVPVGDWILRTACRQIKELRSNGHSNLRMAVNISARQFLQRDFAQNISRILHEIDLEPHALELEITESVLIRDTEASAKMLSLLAERGISIALDDFGTGYSSLSYLKRFPIHTLKIDRNFIQGLPEKRDDVAITNAILALATSLGMKVVAEGVETQQQLTFLRERHCHELQGYLFAKPMPIPELKHWLHESPH